MLGITLFLTVLVQIFAESEYFYNTKYIDVAIDHFNFANNKTFKLKYLVNDTYYRSNGPIFFYTGNEGPIETFAQNTGFINDIAPQFNALIVFAEHRYYGESLPFGNTSYNSLDNLGYLSSSQALADFIDVITVLQKQYKSEDLDKLPVIAFGGSYGGMLTAYIRMKYPASVDGAIAASAPIWQFTGLTQCELFNRIITQVYHIEGTSKCEDTIRKSWAILRAQAKSDSGKTWITENFKLCQPLKNETDIDVLVDWISEIYTNVVMVNYPYSTSFLAPLPAYPVREMCNKMNSVNITSDRTLLAAISLGLNVYTNFTGKTKCNDVLVTSEDLGENGWDFQSCTEFVMPMCSTDNDMFENQKWDIKKIEDDCYSKFKVKPTNVFLPIQEYGGKDLKAASNIIFSNGLMDPWSSGGVLNSLSPKLLAIIIPDGAHHFDLRGTNPLDTGSVRKTREFHIKTIKEWLNSYYNARFSKKLRVF